MTHREALARAVDRLSQTDVETPRLDAQVLLAHATGLPLTGLVARLDEPLENGAATSFESAVNRRMQGEPVAYLTGTREFYDVSLRVEPGVFIPRPETEGLVERALAWGDRGVPSRAADACTGTGAIAICLARHGGFDEVHATDLSPVACRLAAANADVAGARVRIGRGDLLDPLLSVVGPGSFDVICANPPYIERNAVESLPRVVQWEPRIALDGGPDGLDAVRRLLDQARRLLRTTGAAFIEIGDDQGPHALAAARRAGFGACRVEADLAGLDRYLIVEARGEVR